jgi:hypothetical protein
MIPGFPVLSVAAILSSFLLFLVLITSAVRQSWNLAVTVLCVSLFLESLLGGITTIIWADNAKIKYYALCDICASFTRSVVFFLHSRLGHQRATFKYTILLSSLRAHWL